MIGKKNKETIHSIFGIGNIFKGEFQLVGPLRVDGILIGEVTTDSRLHISRSGQGEGSIKAKIIEIGGEFRGELFATEKVIIRSTATVYGKITACYLEVEEGAYFSGGCNVTREIPTDFFSDKNIEIPASPMPTIKNENQKKRLITTP